MTKTFIIQDEIVVTQEYIDEVISNYEKMGQNLRLCFGDFDGNKDDIIREIRELTKTGKEILMMHYRFETSEFGQLLKNGRKLDKPLGVNNGV
jgi:hypothetical protein